MPVMIKKLKFKKLLNEYKSNKYELEMIREILKDAHLEFEVYYRRWCAENDVDLVELTKNNQEKVDKIFIAQNPGLVATEHVPKKKEATTRNGQPYFQKRQTKSPVCVLPIHLGARLPFSTCQVCQMQAPRALELGSLQATYRQPQMRTVLAS